MKRRDMFRAVPAAAAVGIAGALSAPGPAAFAQDAARRGGMPPLTIKDVQLIRVRAGQFQLDDREGHHQRAGPLWSGFGNAPGSTCRRAGLY